MLQDLIATLPLGIIGLMGCLVLLLDAFQDAAADRSATDETDPSYLGYLSAAGFTFALLSIYMLWGRDWAGFNSDTFGTMMVMGKFELATCAVIAMIGVVVSLMSAEYAGEHSISSGEYYALINFAAFGMMCLITAVNMVTLFVGLEIMSVAVYVLAAIKRDSAFSAEAGMKYFILGAFGTGFLLYGLAFLYGETVSFEYATIAARLTETHPSGFLTMALFLLIAAFGFKVALVPFHQWTPDVYEGAPTPVTALMATGVKTAAVIAFGRLFVEALPPQALDTIGPQLFNVLALLAVVTMTLGNIVALHQRNLKRMLAYSSVAHAGYLLIGIMAAHLAADPASGAFGRGMHGLLFYLFVYALANLAAFAVIASLGKDGQEDITLDHVSGLAQAHPIGALVLTLGMLSLAGVPPTAGFFGKFALFSDALAVDSDRFLWLVIVAVLNSVISVYYYLRVVVYAYMRDAVRDFKLVRGPAMLAALLITGFAIIQVGVFPGKYLQASADASAELGAMADTVAAQTGEEIAQASKVTR